VFDIEILKQLTVSAAVIIDHTLYCQVKDVLETDVVTHVAACQAENGGLVGCLAAVFPTDPLGMCGMVVIHLAQGGFGKVMADDGLAAVMTQRQ
jgi:hypothetical protein